MSRARAAVHDLRSPLHPQSDMDNTVRGCVVLSRKWPPHCQRIVECYSDANRVNRRRKCLGRVSFILEFEVAK